jgi:hypothetical protein
MLEKLVARRIKYLIQVFNYDEDYKMIKNWNGVFIFYINTKEEENA